MDKTTKESVYKMESEIKLLNTEFQRIRYNLKWKQMVYSFQNLRCKSMSLKVNTTNFIPVEETYLKSIFRLWTKENDRRFIHKPLEILTQIKNAEKG